MKKIYSILYSLIIGIGMIIMWFVFYINEQIPEINTAPIELSFHLVAEFLTAILLIISSIGLSRKKAWAKNLNIFSMGMLFYTLIMSSGYFVQNNQLIFLYMFLGFIILGSLNLKILFRIK